MRRVTGSVDVPLTPKGKTQARVLGLRTRQHDLRVFAAPNSRSTETARRIKKSPHAADWLKPWPLGRHEGRELGEARKDINRLVENPDTLPGKSRSGVDGESFNTARARIIGGVQRQRAAMTPSDKTLNITSGRVIQIVHAWAANGRRADGSVNTKEITSERGEFSKPGQLFRLEPGGLRQVKGIDRPGQYFAQHGETTWNSEGAGQ